MTEAITKDELLSLEPNTKTDSDFYKSLVLGLHENSPVLKTDLIEGSLAKKIVNSIDWQLLANNLCGEDEFFNGEKGLYTSLKNGYKDYFDKQQNNYKSVSFDGDSAWQKNVYWNESLAKLLQILAQNFDMDTCKTYENSGLIIELEEPDEDGAIIDNEHLRASINAAGAKASMRIIDIMDADAGNSFAGENDIYWYGRYYERLEISYYIGDIPYNIIMFNVLFKSEANDILEKIYNENLVSSNEFKKLITIGKTNENAYIYSGSITGNTDITEDIFISTKIDTERGRSTFKIVKNPWVIPWYNFDGNSYGQVRGSDKKISALTYAEKLGFTRQQSESSSRWIRLLMPQNKRRVEVEDLNRNFWVIGQVLAAISAYLLDPEGPIGGLIEGVLKEIGQLWENMVYLWATLALLLQKAMYTETYAAVVYLNKEDFLPFMRYDDFDKFKPETSPSVFTDELIFKLLNNMTKSYLNKNLAILPVIRVNNYEHNYYQGIVLPGVYFYDRNDADPHWERQGFSFNDYIDETIQYDGDKIYIDLDNYKSKFRGIRWDEEFYYYVSPLTACAGTGNEYRFYGLGRDNIVFNSKLYTKNTDGSYKKSKITTLSIQIQDVTAFLYNNDAPIKNVIQIIASSEENSVNVSYCSIEEDAPPFGENEATQKVIQKGFYQGELLSVKVDT